MIHLGSLLKLDCCRLEVSELTLDLCIPCLQFVTRSKQTFSLYWVILHNVLQGEL